MKKLVVLACGLLLAATQVEAKPRELGIAVKPKENVLIGPGPVSTCLDLHQAASTGTEPNRSAVGPVIRFSKFKLAWRSNDTLTIKRARVVVRAPEITDGKYAFNLTQEEIGALLGTDSLSVGQGPVVLKSHAKSRAGTEFPPCGLAVGSIPLRDGMNTPAFTAKVTVRIVGTAADHAGQERIVKARARATAQWMGQ